MIRLPWAHAKPPVEAARVAVQAQPIVVVDPRQPTPPTHAAYRFDRICRDRDRRRAEGLPRHGDHRQMTGEAIQYVGVMLEQGAVSFDQAMAMIDRLKATE